MLPYSSTTLPQLTQLPLCALQTAHSTLLALRRSQQLRLLQIQRHWATALSSLDPQIQELPLGRFLGEFEGDRGKALRGIVGGMLRERQPPMGQVEQSARKRCVC